MAERRFVLEPLAEVHPDPAAISCFDWMQAWHQVQDQTVRRLGPFPLDSGGRE
jgi:7,8-dihydro-6-hydroxymethylpterin-pyrophosphokinase